MLARYDLVARDEFGNVIEAASVEVRQEVPGAPLAAIKSDRTGTTAESNPMLTDSSGKAGFYVVGGYYKITVTSGLFSDERRYVGIGLAQGSDDASSGSAQREVTAAGAITADPEDDVIVVNKTVGEATTVNVDWSTRTKPLTVVDGKGDAATNNISIVPATGQTQYAIVDYVVTIDGNGGLVKLTPRTDGTGAF